MYKNQGSNKFKKKIVHHKSQNHIALPYSSYSQYLVSSQFVAHTTMKRWWRWYNIVLTFVLLLSPTFTVLGVEIFVKRKSDLNTVAGARAELVCEVRDLRDELKYCEWFSPNGK